MVSSPKTPILKTKRKGARKIFSSGEAVSVLMKVDSDEIIQGKFGIKPNGHESEGSKTDDKNQKDGLDPRPAHGNQTGDENVKKSRNNEIKERTESNRLDQGHPGPVQELRSGEERGKKNEKGNKTDSSACIGTANFYRSRNSAKTNTDKSTRSRSNGTDEKHPNRSTLPDLSQQQNMVSERQDSLEEEARSTDLRIQENDTQELPMEFQDEPLEQTADPQFQHLIQESHQSQNDLNIQEADTLELPLSFLQDEHDLLFEQTADPQFQHQRSHQSQNDLHIQEADTLEPSLSLFQVELDPVHTQGLHNSDLRTPDNVILEPPPTFRDEDLTKNSVQLEDHQAQFQCHKQDAYQSDLHTSDDVIRPPTFIQDEQCQYEQQGQFQCHGREESQSLLELLSNDVPERLLTVPSEFPSLITTQNLTSLEQRTGIVVGDLPIDYDVIVELFNKQSTPPTGLNRTPTPPSHAQALLHNLEKQPPTTPLPSTHAEWLAGNRTDGDGLKGDTNEDDIFAFDDTPESPLLRTPINPKRKSGSAKRKILTPSLGSILKRARIAVNDELGDDERDMEVDDNTNVTPKRVDSREKDVAYGFDGISMLEPCIEDIPPHPKHQVEKDATVDGFIKVTTTVADGPENESVSRTGGVSTHAVRDCGKAWTVLGTHAKSIGLEIRNLGGSGNCMYLSVVDQLSRKKKYVGTHLDLRREVCQFLEENIATFKHFISEKAITDTDDQEPRTQTDDAIDNLPGLSDRLDMRFQRYLDEQRGNAYGDHLVLQAVAKLYNVKIRILRCDPRTFQTTWTDVKPGENESKHNIVELVLGFVPQVHYVSLAPSLGSKAKGKRAPKRAASEDEVDTLQAPPSKKIPPKRVASRSSEDKMDTLQFPPNRTRAPKRAASEDEVDTLQAPPSKKIPAKRVASRPSEDKVAPLKSSKKQVPRKAQTKPATKKATNTVSTRLPEQDVFQEYEEPPCFGRSDPDEDFNSEAAGFDDDSLEELNETSEEEDCDPSNGHSQESDEDEDHEHPAENGRRYKRLPTRSRNEHNKPLSFIPMISVNRPDADCLCEEEDDAIWIRDSEFDNIPPRAGHEEIDALPWVAEADETWKAASAKDPVGLRELPKENTPIGYFDLLWEEEMWDRITENTDKHILNEHNNSNKNSRYYHYDKKRMGRSEIYIIVGLLLTMALIPKTSTEWFWRTKDEILHTPYFGKTIARNRFQCLQWNIHVSPDAPTGCKDPFFEVRPLIEMFNRRAKAVYNPSQKLGYDELTWKVCGRAPGKRYNKSKPDKSHFEVFACSDAMNGYVCGIDLNAGPYKTTYKMRRSSRKAPNILCEQVMGHMEKMDLLDKGRHVYTDNRYTTPTLAQELLERRTLICGTVRENSFAMPRKFKHKHMGMTKQNKPSKTETKMERGEVFFRRNNELLALQYQDKKTVRMLSTIHRAELAKLSKGYRKVKGKTLNLDRIKPTAILDYNKTMNAVDRSGQIAGNNSACRKTRSWKHKFFVHIFVAVITNAYILHRSVNKGTSNELSHAFFCLKLSQELVKRGHGISEVLDDVNEILNDAPERHAHARDAQTTRLIGRQHWPAYTTNSAQRARQPKRCVACKSRKSVIICKACDVSLCTVPCFEFFHTKNNYRNAIEAERAGDPKHGGKGNVSTPPPSI